VSVFLSIADSLPPEETFLSVWFTDIVDKLKGRSRIADGWEAVATEGEELHDTHR
jgi:hypothetical protein